MSHAFGNAAENKTFEGSAWPSTRDEKIRPRVRCTLQKCARWIAS
jgi:hypothetical protein